MSADRPSRRDGSSYTIIPSKYLLVIRGHSRLSAVRLFDELLNERCRRANGGLRSRGRVGAPVSHEAHQHGGPVADRQPLRDEGAA